METLSFIDINQDCIPEIVYMTNNEVKYSENGDTVITLLTITGYTPANVIRFADYNKDGAIDIIIPEADSAILHIYKQKNVKAVGDLCSNIKLNIEFEKEIRQLQVPDGYTWDEHVSNWLLINDFTMDTNIDIIAVMTNSDHDRQMIYSDSEQLRTKLEIKDNLHVNKIAFFHSGNFPLGMYFLIETDYKIEFIDYPQILNDKYFISVTPLTSRDNINDRRHGVIIPGVTTKIYYHNRRGENILLVRTSSYQSNGNLILMPFNLFGLGNVDTYIEKIIIKYKIENNNIGRGYFMQAGVPPNSQLYIFPFPKNRPESWILETFLSPFITVPVLAIVVTIVMVILGGIWIYLE